MKNRLFLLLTLIFTFLQGYLLPPVFFEEILVVIFAVSRPLSKSAPLLFIAGMALDLLQNQRLGATSLIFLLFALFVNLSKPQVRFQTKGGLLYLLFLVTILDVSRAKIIFSNLFEGAILVSICFAFLIFHFIWQPSTEGGIRIR